MRQLTFPLLSSCLWLICASALAEDFVFEGKWRTTNRKLDGVMTCEVTELGQGKWQGRFFGVWHGTPFDYTVPFSGPPASLTGTATIDGAAYDWTGEIDEANPARFKGTFGGSRYTGYFDLQEKPRAGNRR